MILITGCDTGFGNLTAKELDKLGCVVFATCLNQTTADKLNKETSSNTIVKLMDITNTDQIQNVYNDVLTYCNKNETYLYGLINNAGIIEVSPFECLSPNSFNKMININLIGMANVCRIFIPLIRNEKYNKYLNKKYSTKLCGLLNRGKAGRIVNITSIAGVIKTPFLSGYCASKHGALGYSDCLRFELNRYFNIWVSSVEPSFTVTPLYERGMKSGERARNNWRKLKNSKDIMKSYNLEKFVYCIEKRSNIVNLVANKNINKVINVIISGLRSKFPLKHYYPTFQPAIIVILKSYLPSFILDNALDILFN